MKLEPVYLVAPEPAPPSVSRRAFLWTAVLGPLVGGSAGFLAGYVTGRPAAPSAGPEAEPLTVPADFDVRLTWALRLLEADDETFLAQAVGFLSVANRHADDPRIRDGLGRLARILVEHADVSRARSVARPLCDLLDRIDPNSESLDAAVRRRLEQLAR
jgi:hypothetical protein